MIKKLLNHLKTFFKFKRKNISLSNNPCLTKLMDRDMTFDELKKEETKLIEKRIKINAKICALKYNKRENKANFNENEINDLNDQIYQINDLLGGIKTKIRLVGFEYEIKTSQKILDNYNNESNFIDYKTVILGKDYMSKFTEDDIIEIVSNLNIIIPFEILNIRQIKKPKEN